MGRQAPVLFQPPHASPSLARAMWRLPFPPLFLAAGLGNHQDTPVLPFMALPLGYGLDEMTSVEFAHIM